MKYLILLLALTACGNTNGVVDYGFKDSPTFLIAGQSNSVSPAQSHPPYYSQTGRVTINDYYNGNTMRIPTASDPINSGICWIYLGDFMNRDVTFVSVGAGNTSTTKWKNYLYQNILDALKVQEFDAVLWVQGESDFAEGISESETYQNMKFVIEQSRLVQPGLKWFVALDSALTSPIDNRVRLAQKRIIREGLAFQGPDLDQTLRTNIDWMQGDPTKGNEFVGEGLRQHGLQWFKTLYPNEANQ